MIKIKLKSNNPFGNNVTCNGIQLNINDFVEVDDSKVLGLILKMGEHLIYVNDNILDLSGMSVYTPVEEEITEGGDFKEEKPMKKKRATKSEVKEQVVTENSTEVEESKPKDEVQL